MNDSQIREHIETLVAEEHSSGLGAVFLRPSNVLLRLHFTFFRFGQVEQALR
jgi:hypothetical protein